MFTDCVGGALPLEPGTTALIERSPYLTDDRYALRHGARHGSWRAGRPSTSRWHASGTGGADSAASACTDPQFRDDTP